MRKGQRVVPHYMVVFIIVIIFLAVAYAFAGNIGNRTIDVIQNGACEREVISHIFTKEASYGKNLKPIRCETVNQTIVSKNVEEIKFLMAEDMKSCWKTWKKGQADLYGAEVTDCRVCYLLDFEEKNILINDFQLFLSRTNMPSVDYTYLQYFISETENEEFSADKAREEKALLQMQSSFKTDSKKAVIFYYTKNQNKILETTELLDTAANNIGMGSALGFIGGAIDSGTTCGFFLSGFINNVCINTIHLNKEIHKYTSGLFVAGEEVNDIPSWLSFILIKDYDKAEFEEMGCEIVGPEHNK